MLYHYFGSNKTATIWKDEVTDRRELVWTKKQNLLILSESAQENKDNGIVLIIQVKE